MGIVYLTHAQDWVPYLSEGPLNVELSEFNRVDEKYGKNHQLIIFRYINTSENSLTISFTREVEYVNRTNSNGEQTFNLILQPHQTLEYAQDPRNKAFYVFKKDNNGLIKGSLAQFEITNLTIQ